MARDLQQRRITFKQQTPLIVCNFVHGPLLFKGKDDDDDCLGMGADSFSFFSKVEEEVRLLNEESYVLLFLSQDFSQSLFSRRFHRDFSLLPSLRLKESWSTDVVFFLSLPILLKRGGKREGREGERTLHNALETAPASTAGEGRRNKGSPSGARKP